MPAAVKEIVTGNKAIHDCMRMNVINYTALAVRIRPEVERMLGGSVNLNTIVVAIKRYADSFERVREVRENVPLKNARLSLIDGIADLRIPVDEFGAEMAASVLDDFFGGTRDYDLTRMAGTIRILTEDIQGARRTFGARLQETGERLVKIGVMVPGEGPEVVSHVIELLYYNRIGIVNVSFDQDHIVLILNERDALRAYEVLRSKTAP